MLGRFYRSPGDLTWSPDGKRILFEARARSWMYTFATHRATAMKVPVFDVSWAPGSKRFAFGFNDKNTNYQLGVYTLANKSIEQLTAFPGEGWEGGLGPAWSPRGAPIVFVYQTYPGGYPAQQLWSVEPNGRRLHAITGFGEHDAAWAPGGHRFVNSSGYGDESFALAFDVRRPDGTQIRRIPAHGDAAPSWSPGGRWLLAARPQENDGYIFTRPGLWVVRADGTDAHRILKTTNDIEKAAWEPVPAGGDS